MRMDPAALERRLANGRAAAEVRMRARAVQRRPTGKKVPAAGSIREVPEWVTVRPSIAGRLDAGTGEGGSRTVTIDGVEYEQATGIWHIAALTDDVRDGDHFELTAGDWPGTVLRVIKAVRGDDKTARRLPVEEVARPKEWT